MTTGILLVNLGTPKSLKPKDVFRYLNEFLTDSRVIDLPWLQRQLLVRGLIVPARYRQSAHLYSQIWTEEGSPLLVHSRAVQSKLQKALGDSYLVALAMRYQSPSIQEGLHMLRQPQVDKIVVFPLFPQYASATTGSVHQKVMESLKGWPIIPNTVFVNSFADHPAFIHALCQRANAYILDSYDHILLSFHGLPERQIRKADARGGCLKGDCCQKNSSCNRFCYKAQCYATARALAKQLGLNDQRYTVCFQSRLGKEPWIQPYTGDVLGLCAKKGHKRLLVFSPSFVCDCLETTSEIAIEYAAEFKNLGGEELHLVEGLNSHETWIEALRLMVLEQ